MKKHITINIEKPCSENWKTFIPTESGGFCKSCSKDVVDFTRMNDEEIVQFISNPLKKACGRLRVDQLKGYPFHEPVTIRPGFHLLKAGLLSLLVVFSSRPSLATDQNLKPKLEVVRLLDQQRGEDHGAREYTIKGIVKAKDDGSPLPGVNIVLKGDTELGTVTDGNGYFVFPRKLKEGEVLIFSFIGFESKEYVVSKDATETIELALNLSCIVLGEVSVNEVYKAKQSGVKKAWLKVKALF